MVFVGRMIEHLLCFIFFFRILFFHGLLANWIGPLRLYSSPLSVRPLLLSVCQGDHPVLAIFSFWPQIPLYLQQVQKLEDYLGKIEYH